MGLFIEHGEEEASSDHLHHYSLHQRFRERCLLHLFPVLSESKLCQTDNRTFNSDIQDIKNMLGEVNTLEPSIFERIIPFFSLFMTGRFFLSTKWKRYLFLLVLLSRFYNEELKKITKIVFYHYLSKWSLFQSTCIFWCVFLQREIKRFICCPWHWIQTSRQWDNLQVVLKATGKALPAIALHLHQQSLLSILTMLISFSLVYK